MRVPLEIYEPLVARGLLQELPTSRLYLLDHVADLRAKRRVPVARVGLNVFTLADTAFVVRTTDDAGLGAARRSRRVVWIIDDHFGEGSACPFLPETYRARLAGLHVGFEPQILSMADTVLASCDALATHYRDLGVVDVRVVHPRYPVEAVRPPVAPEERSVGILQTRSHLGDLRSIAPALAEALAVDPQLRIVHCLEGCHTDLPRDPRIEALKPLAWRAYVRWRRAIAVGLYPLLDTGFNRYRSLNKILEYVTRGAVPLVSDVPAMAEVPGDFRVSPTDWRERVLSLAADRTGRARLHGRARDWMAASRFHASALETLDDLV